MSMYNLNIKIYSRRLKLKNLYIFKQMLTGKRCRTRRLKTAWAWS